MHPGSDFSYLFIYLLKQMITKIQEDLQMKT